jgi:hypothetical protein
MELGNVMLNGKYISLIRQDVEAILYPVSPIELPSQKIKMKWGQMVSFLRFENRPLENTHFFLTGEVVENG